MSDADFKQPNRNQPPMPQSQTQSAPGEISAAKKAVAAKLLVNYQPGAFDEALGKNGELRRHYVGFLQALEEIEPADRKRRWENSRRLVLHARSSRMEL